MAPTPTGAPTAARRLKATQAHSHANKQLQPSPSYSRRPKRGSHASANMRRHQLRAVAFLVLVLAVSAADGGSRRLHQSNRRLSQSSDSGGTYDPVEFECKTSEELCYQKTQCNGEPVHWPASGSLQLPSCPWPAHHRPHCGG